ncbi:hypothetical protein PR048_011787 [Dryococelus australis]|uniref:Apple domain-containing protein n=1 Tax=Dryococelus australis TaxID=614101 RepID=A0ABQ9HML2_9NEOP|nr:hypothetical protein PR048_011787 [Dryococelus australis]
MCVSELANCEYSDMVGRFLPYTDRYVPQTFSVAECRLLCDQEREFTCRSFNFNLARHECFLSSDDTFAAARASLLPDRAFFYSERGTCSNGDDVFHSILIVVLNIIAHLLYHLICYGLFCFGQGMVCSITLTLGNQWHDRSA